MARIRTIKPEFPQSETIGRLSRDARLLFIQLWTLADDDGRARASSRMLASLLYPYDDDAPSLIGIWLDELEDKGCIRRYEAEGSQYLDIPNWLKHQKIDRPSSSRLPEYREGSRGLANNREGSSTDLGPVPVPVPVSRTTPRKRGLPKTSFQEGWEAEGLTERTRPEFERFRRSAIANARKYANWQMAWENWLTSPYCKLPPEPPPSSADVLPIKGFHARDGTPEMAAWDAYWRATKGTNAPRSKRLDGYLFDSRWPPGYEAADGSLEDAGRQSAFAADTA